MVASNITNISIKIGCKRYESVYIIKMSLILTLDSDMSDLTTMPWPLANCKFHPNGFYDIGLFVKQIFPLNLEKVRLFKVAQDWPSVYT